MNIAERQKPPPGDLFLDHVAHFVPDLDAAAAIFEELGFTVTPVSAHLTPEGPAGTSNRCVMLEEGYIEILAPTLDTPNAQRVRAQMARYDGVHLACFGTPDARAEHLRLTGHGFAPEPVVNLERTLDSGELARFNVVYVAPGKMAEGRVQYVRHLTPQHLWQERYLNEFSLKSVFVVAKDPVAAAARWARFSGLIPQRTEYGIRLESARGSVLFQHSFPWESPAAPALAGYELSCRHPESFAARCSEAGIAVRQIGRRYAAALPAALGGAWLFG